MPLIDNKPGEIGASCDLHPPTTHRCDLPWWGSLSTSPPSPRLEPLLVPTTLAPTPTSPEWHLDPPEEDPLPPQHHLLASFSTWIGSHLGFTWAELLHSSLGPIHSLSSRPKVWRADLLLSADTSSWLPLQAQGLEGNHSSLTQAEARYQPKSPSRPMWKSQVTSARLRHSKRSNRFATYHDHDAS